MKVIVTVSGGKDSTAALLWTIHEFCGGRTDNIIALFNDTGFEHSLTYEYINYLETTLHITIVRCRSSKFDDFMDMVRKKGRFPSTKARFCSEELKIKPTIDFILDNVNEDMLVITGVRHQESKSRASLLRNCTYFRGYFEPYAFDKEGKPRLYTYRKKDVERFVKSFAHELLRPIIEWSEQDAFAYCEKYGIKTNPLYKNGFSRVGCFPCIMATKDEVRLMADRFMVELERLENYEIETGRYFFPPNYIPRRYCTKIVALEKGRVMLIPTVRDVINYVQSKESKKFRRHKDTSLQLFCNELVPCHS